MKDFERRATLASIAVVVLVVAFGSEAITAETIGDTTVETRAYSGTREIRHTVDVGSTASSEEDYHGVFDVEASRTDKRSGNTVFETETRSFTVRSGGYRINAAMREVIVRDEHVASGSSDVMLDESALDRATFGYLAPEPVNGVRGYAPFDGIDREWIVEKYDEPPLADTLRPGVYANSAARSTETSISHVRGETNSGSISEVISPDGTVRGGGTDTAVEESFEQHADGSGRSTSSAPGFYNVDLQIAAAAPEPAGSTYTIVISRKATGREIGPPPYPVDTGTVTIPDWYPGGKALPVDTDVLTASGTADTPVPATCGAASRGLLAHRVIDRRTWTRITGITEADSDERYWAGRTLLCEIERRHTETYDLTSGKRRTVDDTTTSLGIARL